jgi:hypothetical protein
MEVRGTMKRMSLMFAVLLVISLAGASCKQKQQPPVPPPMQEGMPGQPGAQHGMMGGGPEKKVIVPEDVKASWEAVKIEVEFKEKKTRKEFSVPLNSEFPVPDSDLTLKAGVFLPHFTMAVDQITSNSNNPENPACNVEVLVKGNQVFKGWLFTKFPDVHPFQHDRYGVKLVGGIKK